MVKEDKKDLMRRILNGTEGVKRCAHLCALPFDVDPAGVAADMREIVPPEILPDVVFIMTTEYVMRDIDSRDETPKARKLIAQRLEKLQRHFGSEMQEGARRVKAQLDQMFPKRK